MKINEQWLREWVNPELGLDEIGHQLTMAGCEVDAVESVATDFTGIVVAEVQSVEKHPDADKLNVCKVNNGQDVVQIVCGAPNVRAGMKAPLAMIGAVLPMQDEKPLKIKKGKLRGVESQGMLCSAAELGMSDSSEGLLDLPADAPVGVDVREYLQLNDRVLELGITPNRGDCLSVAGVAREVSVLTSAELQTKAIPAVPAVHAETFAVTLGATSACPRYVGRVIRNVNPKAETPFWIQEKLRRVGLRSISPLVDVTNMSLIELGQPMHAFDYAKLQGNIDVRMAQPGESLKLLDGSTVELKDNTLLITDASGPIAMAGIMGGNDSAVDELVTTDVFLESAYFAPEAIAGRARQYGMQTDASYRYERGVSPELCIQAMEYATQLILDICGGEPGPVIDTLANDSLLQRREVHVRHARIERVLGIELERAEVAGILARLDCGLTETSEGWQVTVPLTRFDISIEEDLIEEVARVRGYDSIPAALSPLTPLLNLPAEAEVTTESLYTSLLQRGYQEAVTFSFVDERLEQFIDPDAERIELANPISADLGVMRSSLWSGLLPAVAHNLNRQQTRVRLFEVGPTFAKKDGAVTQKYKLAGAITGLAAPEQWAQEKRKADFFDIKGDVEAVLAQVSGADFYFMSVAHPALHPGQSAQITTDDQVVGWVGALHPRLAKTLSLSQSVYLFELDLAVLTQRRLPQYQAVPKFPSIRRDLALLLDADVPAEALNRAVRAHAAPQVIDWQIFDLYQGSNIESGKKSVALSLILQDISSTLEDATISNIVAQVVEALQKETGAVLR